jgi:superfamily I DNA and/or RNA helicase
MQKIRSIMTFTVILLLGLNVAGYFSFHYTAITWTQVIVYAMAGMLVTSLLVFIVLTRYRPGRNTAEKLNGSLLLGFISFTFLLFYIPFGLNDWFSAYQGAHTIKETDAETAIHSKQGHTWKTASITFSWKGYAFSVHNKNWKKVKSVTFNEHEGLFGMMILKNVELHE